jgi:hypothetical protein
MIRILLLGRTGNNLFQYAIGRVLAEKHQVPLVLDGSWFDETGWKEVSHFLKLPLKAKVVRRCPLGVRALRKITGKHYWEYRGVPVLREPGGDLRFDPAFLEAPTDCMLFGYFQTPLYFAEIASGLREELNTLLAEAIQDAQEVRAMLLDPRSVAVHVRRGDFLDNPVFQVCDLRYYAKSMEEMRTRVPGARFFIFSDDPGWCRSEFTGSDIHVMGVETVERNPLHDLRLMSTASHHIIANSSYSWWAAWLGDKPGQEVIMPDRWFTTDINAPVSEKRWKP